MGTSERQLDDPAGRYGRRHDADIDAPYAWGHTTGSAATRIGILDSGIDLDHEDLARKVVASYNATKSRTLDDKYGHGTAVAGVAAPVSDNAVGSAGVGFSSSLMKVKVLDDRGIGSCSTVAKGINWAADNGANVINMSLGFSDCTAGRRAVNYAWGKGVILTAAAGNDGDQSATYPAYYANVMAVAATDNADMKTSFSQYGGWVDLAAPGINVYTTFPNHSNRLGNMNYDYGKGTSMSAPFVARAAGLLWPGASDANSNGRANDEVRARLETCADDIAGTSSLWTAGRLNVCNAAAANASACPCPERAVNGRLLALSDYTVPARRVASFIARRQARARSCSRTHPAPTVTARDWVGERSRPPGRCRAVSLPARNDHDGGEVVRCRLAGRAPRRGCPFTPFEADRPCMSGDRAAMFAVLRGRDRCPQSRVWMCPAGGARRQLRRSSTSAARPETRG